MTTTALILWEFVPPEVCDFGGRWQPSDQKLNELQYLKQANRDQSLKAIQFI